MKTLEEKINELTEKHERDIQLLVFRSNIERETGISPKTCFDSSGKTIITFEVETFEQARKLRDYFPPELSGRPVQFAGKDSIKTFSPYLLKFENMDHEGRALKNSCKIVFASGPHEIWIELSPLKYHADILANDRKQLKHLGFGRYSSKNLHYLDMFGKQRYYGDSFTNYASCQEETKEFEYVIFHGHVEEFVHLIEE